ncbi:MAG: hypothetical protein L6V93_11605 [Clostridiales bacterium]|nr:MAG: hypothetical protein L6V93_11605 [Clostridiales bacterium]
MCNDKIVSCVSNTGVGYLKHISGEIITKYWEKKREIILPGFPTESADFTY